MLLLNQIKQLLAVVAYFVMLTKDCVDTVFCINVGKQHSEMWENCPSERGREG